MLKKLIYGLAFLLSIAIISAAVTTVTMDVRIAQAQSGKYAPAWVDHPNAVNIQQPTVPTKHELFSEDHTADVVAIEQVWAAYTFYTDTNNGPGMASIFTPDGVDQHIWNDGHGKFFADFGIVPPGDESKDTTPEGPIGGGCVLKGRDQIAQYKRRGMVDPLAWPIHSHHFTPSILVKVSDDGQTAVLTVPSILGGVNDKGETHFTTGGYRAFFKKTSEGWEIAELYTIFDHPSVTQACDVNGPLPRVFTPGVW
jgi:hypothetical protein